MSLTYCISAIDVLWKTAIRPWLNGFCSEPDRLLSILSYSDVVQVLTNNKYLSVTFYYLVLQRMIRLKRR